MGKILAFFVSIEMFFVRLLAYIKGDLPVGDE